MPELPEVETVKSFLYTNLIDDKFIDVKVFDKKIFKNFEPNELLNSKITDIKRRGKFLLIFFYNKKVLVSHLRMEGKYGIDNKQLNPKHTMVSFILSSNRKLDYNDTRKFGTMHLFNEDELNKQIMLKKLGPEPFDKEFNSNYLQSLCFKSNKKIKTFLLDQTNVAGIGNIYVDEILFASSVLPDRLCKSLNTKEINKIVLNTKAIMEKAVQEKGSSIDTYLYDGHNKGNYQNFLKVHTKFKQPCTICNSPIKKQKLNGRGTYFCIVCQK